MRVALAYSGSLEGSAAIVWLRETQRAEVAAVTLDLGQGRELEAVRDRALALGAQRAHVLDAREEFAERYVVPALRADAMHAGRVPMALALSRPIIAEKLIEIAGIEHADAVAYTGGHSGASRLERLLSSLAPALTVLAPATQWTLTPEELSSFGRRHGLVSVGGRTRDEATFWGRSRRCTAPASDAEAFYATTRPPSECPDEPAIVEIAFEHGVPTALNGVTLPLLELIASLGTLASTHGVGRVELDGLLCDAPAAVLIHTAHRELTRAANAPDLERFAGAVTAEYVALVEDAGWFSPLRTALDAFVQVAQQRVSGRVRLRLLKGRHQPIGTEISQPPETPPAALHLLRRQR
jgi:argininosuccinate synthase